MIFKDYQDGRRLALFGGTLCNEGFISVLSFGLTCFAFGYTVGKDRNDTKTQK